jgi:fructan beta-fructosidase
MADPRPAYHLTPRRNWLNDPNGLIHYRGRWHAFFQHNPEGTDWGHMSWGHASSTDLVHWREHPLALRATPEELCFSGSAVEDADGSLVLAYTRVDVATGVQSIALARSTDGGESFERWAGNPVLDRGSTAFRDPQVIAHDGGWLMVAVEAEQPRVLLHRSADLVSWRYLSELELPWPAATEYECPDLFPITDEATGAERWVLLCSVTAPGAPFPGGRGSVWCVGDLDGTTFRPDPDPEAHGWLDAGPDCYAGITFDRAPDGRRVFLAWMSNWEYAATHPAGEWRGGMTLPRELTLRGGRLRSRPVPEVAAYGERLVLADGEARELPGARVAHLDGALVVERPGPTADPAFAWNLAVATDSRGSELVLDVFVDTGSLELFTADGTTAVTLLVRPEPTAEA